MYRECLQKIIGFNQWHLNSLNERFYALPTINRLNELIQNGEVASGTILELGCGLGDIISSIYWHDRLGYDIDRKVIFAAKIIHPEVSFRVGTFNQIRDKKISVLIALNFMHEIKYEDCYKYFSRLFRHNEVDFIVVDAVQTPPYPYAHNYEKLFKKFGYSLEYKSRGYTAWENSRRKILYFRKVKKLVTEN